MFDYQYVEFTSLPMRTQMAIEEFLLKKSAQQGVATVRFWSAPRDTVVLGYAQSTDVVKKNDGNFDVTRRITGGSHVQFGSNCLAYTFTVPRDGSFRNFEDLRAYYADIVARSLEEIGINEVAVDNNASTINVGGKIVASHAIIWGVESALIHGLMLIDPYDIDVLDKRVFLKERKIGNKIYPEYAALKNLPAVSNLLTRIAANKNPAERNQILKQIVAESILKRTTKEFEKISVIERQLDKQKEILFKHASRPWITERLPPFTEDEIESIPGEELNGELKKDQGYCLFIQVKDKDFKKMAEQTEDSDY